MTSPSRPPKSKARVAQCLREHPGDPHGWFDVVMVNPSGLALTRADLDSMLRDRPLLLHGSDGHTAWVNSAALAASKITAATRDPVGGRIEHDAAGAPTGTLRDNAAGDCLRGGAVAGPRLRGGAPRQALQAMRAVGITSVQDAAVDERDMEIYKRLYDTHRLNMRVRGTLHLMDLHEPAATLIGRAVKFRAKWAVDPDFLRADAVKIFADGVIEYPSQTAALLQPYLDAQGRPTRIADPRISRRTIWTASSPGGPRRLHRAHSRDRRPRRAFGARRLRLRAAAERDAGQSRPDRALEVVEPADFHASPNCDVIANFQLYWAERDEYIEKGTLPYLGPERSRYFTPRARCATPGR